MQTIRFILDKNQSILQTLKSIYTKLSTIFLPNDTAPLFITIEREEIQSKMEYQSWQELKNEYRFSEFDSIDLEEYADMMFV